MKLEKIVLRSFLSHADTTWEPNGARLATLIGANGAGKSSLLDAIAYTLYDAARGRTDDLVKLGASDMSATVEFAFAGDRYRVTRGRSTRAGGKSFLELHVADGEGWRPLTADSIRETQAAIEQLLRMDADTFTSAALLQQGRLMALLEATPAERKRVLGTVLGLDRYERAEAEARLQVNELRAKGAARREQAARLEHELADRDQVAMALRVAMDQADGIVADEAAMAEELAAARDKVGALTEAIGMAMSSEADVRRLTAEVDEQKRRYVNAEQRRRTAVDRQSRAEAALGQRTAIEEATRQLPGLHEELDLAEAEVVAHQAATQAWITARDALSVAANSHGEALTAVQTAYQERADRVIQLESMVSALQPVICPECGATFDADPAGLAGRLEVARQELAAAPRTLEEPDTLTELRAAAAAANSAIPSIPDPSRVPQLKQRVFDAEVLSRQAAAIAESERIREEAQAEAEAAGADVITATEAGTAARAALDEARARGAVLASLREERDSAKAEVTRLEGRAVELANARRGLDTAIAQADARLKQLDAAATELEQLQASLAEADLELGRLERLVVAFGVNGIPARIIESVLPELTRHANDVLASLRPGMTLDIRAQRAKKSGDGMIEALDLIVRDDAGERSLSLFSGGERMSVALALAVGLSRLVARRAGTAIRTLVVDEPDGLDADARRAFGLALRQLAHAGELERVVLVSHHPDLAEYGDVVYSVTKDAVGSHVGVVT